jgi:acyl carrier protein
MNNNILHQLQEVFRKVFRQNDLVINNNTSAKDIQGWDSFMHIELISTIESEFKITFSFNEVIKFNTVGDMIKSIEEKIKK